ncbi:MAG: GNAT family N-acetyltransferase [Fimbriimonadaceae bacterium]
MFDAAAVVRQWESFYPERYWVDEALVSLNTLDCPLFLPEQSVVDDGGFVLLKLSAAGRAWEGGAAPTAHVSALGFSGPEEGRRLLERARASLAEHGIVRWQFGGDWRHFFPGVPAECDELARLLSSCGFEKKEAQYDVERDLQGYEPPVQTSGFARQCAAGEAGALDSFLAREFPGRWRRDVMDKFAEDPSRIFGLFLDGACQGFAMTQMDGDTNRRAGAVWSRDLGPSWAALGPIGVSSALRGRGLGHALLGAALCSLRDLGARRTIIDWTTLTEFYGAHGFVVTREYATYSGQV